MFGSHLSISKGLSHAVEMARGLGMGTVQVFTKSQRTWANPPLRDDNVAGWCAACAPGFGPTVAHASYLANLATPDEAHWRKSVELFADELARTERLKIPLLVTHPGAHLGSGAAVGAQRVAAALDELFARDAQGSTTVLLESTAGGGTLLGGRLEDLAEVIAASRFPERLGVCLDTAHLWAAGHDFRGRRYAKFARHLDATVGAARVKAWHLNDSKAPLGSHRDRHEHIGAGTIGLDGFRPIVRDARWRGVPKILETPKGENADGVAWDRVNLGALEQLVR